MAVAGLSSYSNASRTSGAVGKEEVPPGVDGSASGGFYLT